MPGASLNHVMLDVARSWRRWSRRIALSLALILVFPVIYCVPFRVSSESMTPALHPGDVLLVDKQVFEWRLPQRWEIIVFHGPEYRSTPYVKRIVGLPNETIEIKDGQLFINGVIMEPPFHADYQLPDEMIHSKGRHGVHAPCRLEPDEYFVLGDNGAASDDSRTWPKPGVKLTAIIGRAIR